MTYDSTKDTLAHINLVQARMASVEGHLHARARLHDRSKLEEPEKSAFDRLTPKLRELTYGSAEYRASLEQLGDALRHHYAVNQHHPEHYPEGVAGMSLLDVLEMLCDWKAASQRHADGDLAKSIQINRERFGLSDQLVAILENTRRELGW